MCDHPLVSIIVINYNGFDLLKDCFTSLKNLTYPAEAIEFIMVDNGSSDRSVVFMKENFPDVKIIENKKNLGFAEPNNMAASMANGEYVAFLNNDMRVTEDWLFKMVEAIKKSPPDVICTGSKILNWHGDKVQFAGGGRGGECRGFELSSLPESEEPCHA
ncbi:MAG: glycosyltransferase, partial [Candidatus Eremiobacterota bacterium]